MVKISTLGIILIGLFMIIIGIAYSIYKINEYDNIKESKVYYVGKKILPPPEDNNCLLWYSDKNKDVYRFKQQTTDMYICVGKDSVIYKMYKEDK